jgi:hypothetical protein
VAVATWAAGINTLLFALDEASPIGMRPVLVVIGLALSLGVTWLLMRKRVKGLPSEVGRSLMKRAAIVSLFTGALTYFVMMQIVMPLLFLFGVDMGLFF